jgi:hypothetical protein
MYSDFHILFHQQEWNRLTTKKEVSTAVTRFVFGNLQRHLRLNLLRPLRLNVCRSPILVFLRIAHIVCARSFVCTHQGLLYWCIVAGGSHVGLIASLVTQLDALCAGETIRRESFVCF